LRGTSDAYGHELWDYYRSGSGYEVIERDDGFIDPSDVAPAFYFSSYKDWPAAEKRGLSYAKGRVLDVGCGAGRVALYLQDRKGLDVLGLDISPLAVKVARLRGVKKTVVLPFERIDFPRGSFDTIVMYGNNFGLFGSKSRARRLLSRLHSMTKPEAVVICESVDIYATSDPVHLRYHRWNLLRGRMAGQVRIRVRYRTYVGKWFDYLLASPAEMREIADGTGWRPPRVLRSKKGPLYVGILRKSQPK